MKRIYSLFFALFILVAANAQTEVKANDVLQVKETEYDFGKIPQGKPVYHFFEVVNKTNKAIKLDNVQASCGCTTPEWSKDEIAPGATAKIKVGYNAASEGGFTKYITVQSAGTTQQITIKGQVWKAPAGAAPANASVQFLKQQVQ
jgi:uncharacterized protein DUF1573